MTRGGIARHVAGVVAVFDRAIIAPRQTTDVAIPAYAAADQADVLDHGILVHRPEQADIVCCRHIDGEVVDDEIFTVEGAHERAGGIIIPDGYKSGCTPYISAVTGGQSINVAAQSITTRKIHRHQLQLVRIVDRVRVF